MEFLETTFKEYFEAGWSRESQLKAMDWYGLDMAFLYPTHGLNLWFFRSMDAELGGALVRAYNNWLHDFCQIDPQRLRPVAGLDLRDPAAVACCHRSTPCRGFSQGVNTSPKRQHGDQPGRHPRWRCGLVSCRTTLACPLC